jgi:hypothetical protein
MFATAISYRTSMDPNSEKDAMSIKSTSTMGSTRALLKSILPSKRCAKSIEIRDGQTAPAATKSQKKAIRAEAVYTALR